MATQTQGFEDDDLAGDLSDKGEEHANAWAVLVPCGTFSGKAFIEDDSEFVIGRNPDVNLQVACDFVSSKHCKIFRENSIVYVEDCSTNGTFLDGERLKKGSRVPLLNGAEITIAKENKKKNCEKKAFIYRFLEEDKRNAAAGGPQGKYHILQVLGSGAFATVNLAVDKDTGEKFAIKIIEKKRMSKAPGGEAKLMDEVNILMKIKHPGCIGIHEVFDTQDRLYLVLELVTGGELFDLTLDKQRFTEDEARPLFQQMLVAVQYLHENGVAHRDLKLENILLRDEKKDFIKISDFGLSRLVGEGSFMQTICGTPEYLAPEVLTKAKVGGYSKAVDIWSLGVILYTMLSGYRPFENTDDCPIFDKIKNGIFGYPDDPWSEVSEAAKDMISSMLVVDPSQRITAEQALNHPWITGESMAAYAKSGRKRTREEFQGGEDEEGSVSKKKKKK